MYVLRIEDCRYEHKFVHSIHMIVRACFDAKLKEFSIISVSGIHAYKYGCIYVAVYMYTVYIHML